MKTTKTSWHSKILNTRYGKPVIFVVAFMVLGVGALWWASAATTTYSLWSNSTVPSKSSVSDSSNIELGVRFKSSVAGYVTGVKFYKGAQNTGIHTGNLWDNKGNLLASVEFTNETASGWQTATFATPISVAANVPYVISYHAPKGHYALNSRYFRNARTQNYLTAPANSASMPNGVYAKGSASSLYPSTSGASANYWVDVLFATQLLDAQAAPAAPANVVGQVTANGVSLSWAASVSASPIYQYNIYRDGNKIATVSGSVLTYTDNTVAAGNTYSYQVQAVDSTSVTSALSAPTSVTVSATSGGGTTGASTCPLPAYPSPSCTGVPANTVFTNTVNGDYIVTTPGKNIDSWHVTGDIIVKTTGVTIKNTQVDGTVTNDDTASSSFTIDASTVGPVSGCAQPGVPSLWGHDFVATRVNLHGHADGIDMGASNVTVRDSFIQPCYLPASIVGSDGYHSDGLQDLCSASCGNLSLIHNTIDARAYYNGQPMGNSALNLGSSADGLHMGSVTLKDNLFMGGGYSTDLRWDYGANWTVTNNAWVSGSYTYAPISTEGTCAHQTWYGNSIVTMGANYTVTGTVAPTGCVD